MQEPQDRPVYPKRLRVVRTIIIEGDEAWVNETLRRSWLQPGDTPRGSGDCSQQEIRREVWLSDSKMHYTITAAPLDSGCNFIVMEEPNGKEKARS